MWTNLEEILELISGQDFSPEKYNDNALGIPYIIGASNIENEQLVINRWTEYPSVYSYLNDLLVVCKGAGVGKMAINNIGTAHIARQIQAVRTCTNHINVKYIKAVIRNNIESIISKANGLIPGLKRELLLSLQIPLPPLAEQKRITAEIERWFTLIGQIEHGKADLQITIKQAKSKILDLAIRGKLVSQDPTDEPAIELLKRINPDFIPCDNGHSVKLPPGWCACKYTDIYTDISSKPYQIFQSQIQESGKYPVVSQSVKHIEGFTDSCNVFSHSLPCIIFGDHTRVVKYIDFDFVVGADGVKIQCPKVNVKWAYYVMEYVSSKIVNKGYSRHFGQVVKFTYALPPLAEQQRIVAKIEELFSTIDSIQKALEA